MTMHYGVFQGGQLGGGAAETVSKEAEMDHRTTEQGSTPIGQASAEDDATMASHTPTPWSIRQFENSIIAHVKNGKDRMQLLHTSWHGSVRASYPLKDESIANMRFAVRAVNNHKALVGALQTARDALMEAVAPTGCIGFDCELREIDRVLASAEASEVSDDR